MAEDFRRHDISERVHLDVMQEITGYLSMLSFGFYALVRLGAICLHTMEIGRIHIVVFADGEIKVYGKNYTRPRF